ncbi:hypothetical protein KP509_36G010300 [Ceratopteris richardii]|uniref:Uncharacterized protein n=1 Tax=Ceratopteris richardii TaxID=49495 RepID=A0A8T2QAQ1_CERRI|nr:hypothetical protein KP509_36G010300 [Ceratopteris richardii]
MNSTPVKKQSSITRTSVDVVDKSGKCKWSHSSPDFVENDEKKFLDGTITKLFQPAASHEKGRKNQCDILS